MQKNNSNVDILFFLEDPGSINFLKDLPKYLNDGDISFNYICEGSAFSFFRDQPFFFDKKEMKADEILSVKKPHLIVVGTSENKNSFSFNLIKEAKKNSIPTLGIVDMLCNFENRFKGNSTDPLKHAPNQILVPDKKTKECFESINFSGNNILVAGNPIYQNAISYKKNYIKHDSLHEKLKILFITEGWDMLNNEASKKNQKYNFFGRGSSDFRTIIAMEELVDSIKRSQINSKLTMRVHPNSRFEDFEPIASEFDEVSSIINPYDDCLKADLVVGITSMLLLEAGLLGKPTLSIMLNPDEYKWMPNIYIGPTKVACSRNRLDKYFINKEYKDYAYAIPSWAKNSSPIRIVKILKTYL